MKLIFPSKQYLFNLSYFLKESNIWKVFVLIFHRLEKKHGHFLAIDSQECVSWDFIYIDPYILFSFLKGKSDVTCVMSLKSVMMNNNYISSYKTMSLINLFLNQSMHLLIYSSKYIHVFVQHAYFDFQIIIKYISWLQNVLSQHINNSTIIKGRMYLNFLLPSLITWKLALSLCS